jgi:hypothetical protein
LATDNHYGSNRYLQPAAAAKSRNNNSSSPSTEAKEAPSCILYLYNPNRQYFHFPLSISLHAGDTAMSFIAEDFAGVIAPPPGRKRRNCQASVIKWKAAC